ncbi:MAG: sulfatase [Candidatus Hydrogenedentes bacterium]|nr:sulfatase [Candidatus Hydrogenedentota bacterium]
MATLRYESAPNASTEPQSPLRLTHLVLNARRDNAAKPIFAEGSEFKTERFTRPSRRTFSRLTQRIDPVLANNYTACLIRMKSPLAGRFTFVWKNAIEPDIAENPGISFTVVGDAQVHEYTLSMEGQDAVAWTGLVSDIGVVGPGNAFEVESITLADMLPHGPERITLGNVTMESVDPDSTVWTVTIPPSSQFETHVAMLDPHTAASDGAVFRVRVQENTGEAITLAEKSIGEAERGRWHRLRASLKPYEGKTINLLFDVDSRGSARSDYAVWGNPIIYSGATKARTPVILISCDTMRADHLSCYGYERSTSPNLDAFAGESVLFENAITPETWTLSAHTSMLTGLYPTHHRVSASTNLSEAVQTLPETLAGAGNLTAGFTGYRLWMSPSSGLAHGFDSYSTPPLVRDMVETKSLVNAWLDSHAGAPFFLFFHNYDLHSKFGTAQCADCDLPYYPPPNTPLHFARGVLEPETLRARCRPSPTDLLIAACGKADALSPQDIAHMIAMYDDSIRGVDAELGEFFGKLKAMDVYDDALIVVTADHGEHFGEHNQYVHEHVYECAARVPLLIKFPNGKYGGKRIRDMVQLVDLMPTILDVAGVAAPASDGQSLLPLVRGEGRAADWAYIRRQTIIAVRNNDWKYLRNIETGVAELYHLANDPRESVSVLDRNPAELPGLIRLAERFFLENEEGWHVAFMRPERDWRGAVVGTTGDAFQTVKLLLGGSLSYSGLLKWDEHTATANVGLLPREELLLRTRAESAPVALQISASKQFLVVLGDAEPVKSRKFRVELDPASPLPKPVLPSQVVKPTFFIWHEATPPAGTRAPALTPEEIEALNALGYGRDIR